jgi:hypothetical protein
VQSIVLGFLHYLGVCVSRACLLSSHLLSQATKTVPDREKEYSERREMILKKPWRTSRRTQVRDQYIGDWNTRFQAIRMLRSRTLLCACCPCHWLVLLILPEPVYPVVHLRRNSVLTTVRSGEHPKQPTSQVRDQ